MRLARRELWVRVPVKTKSLSGKGGAVVMNVVMGVEKVELERFGKVSTVGCL